VAAPVCPAGRGRPRVFKFPGASLLTLCLEYPSAPMGPWRALSRTRGLGAVSASS
jgi:hypothetical protein